MLKAILKMKIHLEIENGFLHVQAEYIVFICKSYIRSFHLSDWIFVQASGDIIHHLTVCQEWYCQTCTK